MKNYFLIFLLPIFAVQSYAHVKLVGPSGGESFMAGEIVKIEWEDIITHTIENWDLLYSIDGGVTWDFVQEDINSNMYSYDWTVPNSASMEARIRIIQDNVGSDYSDDSDNFTIIGNGNSMNPLLIPPTLSGADISLTLQKGEFEFYQGSKTNTFGVNGDILGPTLILDNGQDVSIEVDNQIGETTTIHWHGMHVSAANDGGPHTVIQIGEIWNPQFTVLDKAATYWYHPHLHEKTNEHVLKGIAGFIIVRDDEEASLNLPSTYGVDDIPVVFQTKTFNANRQIVLGTNAMDTVVLANATRNAFVDVPAQVIRLRLLNGSSQRFYNIGLSDDMSFFQIASDGGLLSTPVQLNRLILAPGERAEILVDLTTKESENIDIISHGSELPTGYYGTERIGMNSMMTIPNYNSNPLNGSDFNLLQLQVGATVGGVKTIPTTLANVVPFDEADVDTTRNFLFTPKVFSPSNVVNGPFVINGVSFDLDVINETIPLNNIETWTITNQSMIAHPFHIHDVQFYLLTRNGVRVPENERGRKDVVIVPPQMGTVTFITKFEDFADDDMPYMYHCHMLSHEDDGMMGQFVVVDKTTDVDNDIKRSITIQPNPTSDMIMLDGLSNSTIEIYNTSGHLLKKIMVSEKMKQLDFSKYSSGTYFLNIIDSNNNITYKVIKN